ncbi:MAG: hypothetical protein WDW38_007310 [Sanguina aurantia]
MMSAAVEAYGVLYPEEVAALFPEGVAERPEEAEPKGKKQRVRASHPAPDEYAPPAVRQKRAYNKKA